MGYIVVSLNINIQYMRYCYLTQYKKGVYKIGCITQYENIIRMRYFCLTRCKYMMIIR